MGPRMGAAVAAVLWGFTYALSTFMLPHNPMLIAAVRGLGGAVCLFALARQRIPAGWFGRLVMLGTLNVGLFFGLFFIGALRLPGGVAAIFQALGPLCVLLLAWLVLHRRPVGLQFISVVLGAAGVALVVLKANAAIDGVGVLATLASTLSLSLGSVLINRWGPPPSMSFAGFTAWQLLVGGIELAVVALAAGDYPEAGLTLVNVLGFAILALALTALPFLVWFRAVSHGGAAGVMPFILLTPVTAFVLDALFKQLMPSMLQIAGGVVVIAALLINQYSAKAAIMQAKR